MHTKTPIAALTLITSLLCTQHVMAQEVSTSTQRTITPSIGARIGGYGFRQLNPETDLINWENCRMNGVGIFGNFDFKNTKLYSEISLDTYFVTAQTMNQGIDRVSYHTQGLLGYRLPITQWLVPNIHLGGGAELTRVEIFQKTDSRITPTGFIGVGGELVIKDLHFGMAIRTNVMQLPEYEWNVTGDSASLEYHTELASQMLFSVRYTL